jgi:hypothetical protein
MTGKSQPFSHPEIPPYVYPRVTLNINYFQFQDVRHLPSPQVSVAWFQAQIPRGVPVARQAPLWSSSWSLKPAVVNLLNPAVPQSGPQMAMHRTELGHPYSVTHGHRV